MKAKCTGRSLPSVVCRWAGTFLFLLIILLCIPFSLPKVFGYEPYSVVSGSMEPEIPVGSLVYVTEVQPEKVQEKDIIAFYGGHGQDAMTVHRVVKNEVSEKMFRTKGDANATEDLSPVSYEQVAGQVVFTVPFLGLAGQALMSSGGKTMAAGVLGLALLLHLLAALLERKQERNE